MLILQLGDLLRTLLRRGQRRGQEEADELNPIRYLLQELTILEGNLSHTKSALTCINLDQRVTLSRHRRLRGTRVTIEGTKTHGNGAIGKVKASGPINPGKAIMTEGMLGTGYIGLHECTVSVR